MRNYDGFFSKCQSNNRTALGDLNAWLVKLVFPTSEAFFSFKVPFRLLPCLLEKSVAQLCSDNFWVKPLKTLVENQFSLRH